MSEPSARFEELKVPLHEPVHELEHVPAVLGIPEWWPTGSRVAVVLAHGTQKEDPLLEGLQRALTERKYLTLRFVLPFVQAAKRRPDPPAVLQRTYQAAVSLLARDPTAAPAHVFAGGKNLGAVAAAYAATGRLRAEGLFFLGYPLHKQDDPAQLRVDRLFRVIAPMLFLQGTRDRNCDLDTLRRTLARVGAPVHLHVVEHADHQFRVPKRTGRGPEDVQREILETMDAWIGRVVRS